MWTCVDLVDYVDCVDEETDYRNSKKQIFYERTLLIPNLQTV